MLCLLCVTFVYRYNMLLILLTTDTDNLGLRAFTTLNHTSAAFTRASLNWDTIRYSGVTSLGSTSYIDVMSSRALCSSCELFEIVVLKESPLKQVAKLENQAIIKKSADPCRNNTPSSSFCINYKIKNNNVQDVHHH